MVFLLKLLQLTLQLILGPILWLLRMAAGVCILCAIILSSSMVFAPEMRDGRHVVMAGGLIVGGLIVTAAVDIAAGFDAALGQWIYARQFFTVASIVPGKKIKRLMRRIWSSPNPQ